MNPKITIQTLMCDLTQSERNEYGIKLATRLGDMEAIEAEKKKNADHFKDRIAGLQAACDELSRKVRDGKEWREVECEVLLGSPDREHKQTIRLDTGETIKTERMTESDLQMVMPLNDESIKVGDEIDASREEDENDIADPEMDDDGEISAGGVTIVEDGEEQEEQETDDTAAAPPIEDAAEAIADAPENLELLENLHKAKSVAKRVDITQNFIGLFGVDALPVVIELAKENGFDSKKLAELESFVVAPAPAAEEEY